MNIVVVNGSSRPNSQSRKIADWIVAKLQAMQVNATLVDLHQTMLPMEYNLDVDMLADAPQAEAAWQPIREVVNAADGFVIISPEWNGMVPPALMNWFVYGATDEQHPLAHKPAQIVTVSSGSGGDYPIAELKTFGTKNTSIVYIPGAIAVRKCKDVFNAPEPQAGNESDAYLQKRLQHALSLLLEYAKALATLRLANPPEVLHQYPNGM